MKLRYDEIESEIGTLLLCVGEAGVCALDFEDTAARMKRMLEARFGEVELARERDPDGSASRVAAYLAGELDALDPLATDTGGTPFQQCVWSALRDIAVGETLAYGELARRVGRPGAARAIGSTNVRNPVALILPCHRVVGSDGSLTGYAGGLARKRWLLQHEGALS